MARVVVTGMALLRLTELPGTNLLKTRLQERLGLNRLPSLMPRILELVWLARSMVLTTRSALAGRAADGPLCAVLGSHGIRSR